MSTVARNEPTGASACCPSEGGVTDANTSGRRDEVSLGCAGVEEDPGPWSIARLEADASARGLLRNAREDATRIEGLFPDAGEFDQALTKWLREEAVVDDRAPAVAEAAIRGVIADRLRKAVYALREDPEARLRRHLGKAPSAAWRTVCEEGIDAGSDRALDTIDRFELPTAKWAVEDGRVRLPSTAANSVDNWLWFQERSGISAEYRRLEEPAGSSVDPDDPGTTRSLDQRGSLADPTGRLTVGERGRRRGPSTTRDPISVDGGRLHAPPDNPEDDMLDDDALRRLVRFWGRVRARIAEERAQW